jgi:two-component system CheB/CheR fusion protein
MASDAEFEGLIRHIQQSRGMDFRGYKRTSLVRRITLRMHEVGIEAFGAYQAFLEAHPREFIELLNTVLINVTSFFRDEDAWKALREAVIPEIIAKSGRNPIRIWSVGCASGEEPYSAAMLFAEALGIPEFCRRVKVYATDLDEDALRDARNATYSPREVESVPADLLERYFERTATHYVFQREIRKCVIFGRHNIVNDAPISRIDLLLCRNLLIYLEAETQNMVLPRLHYALAEDGFLFLGKAETQLARSRLFRAVDMKHRLFQRVAQEGRRAALAGGADMTDLYTDGQSLQTRVFEGVIDHAPIAYLVVAANGNLIFANAAARRLFDVGEADLGRPFQDLPISYRPIELRARIEEAHRDRQPVRIEHLEYLRPHNDVVRLTIELSPLTERDGKLFGTLISFIDTTRLFLLQQELDAAQESLETTVEELQSANEELETTNEELQSTNEELETTNEELQSTNEELETLNEELHSANDELQFANEDMRRYSDTAAEYRGEADAILRIIDAGIVVLDQALKVRSWNRWSENAWGVRTESVTGREFATLDIGLPVDRLRPALEQTVRGEAGETVAELDAVDRRGRSMRCRVHLSPLIYDDRSIRGVVVIVSVVAG